MAPGNENSRHCEERSNLQQFIFPILRVGGREALVTLKCNGRTTTFFGLFSTSSAVSAKAKNPRTPGCGCRVRVLLGCASLRDKRPLRCKMQANRSFKSYCHVFCFSHLGSGLLLLHTVTHSTFYILIKSSSPTRSWDRRCHRSRECGLSLGSSDAGKIARWPGMHCVPRSPR